jgi:cobalamin biosynthesis protein CbiG
VERAVSQVLRQSGLAAGSVAVLAGPEADAGKDALADFAEKFRLPFEWIAPERLRAVSDPPDAGGVECAAEGGFRASEAAAVLASGGKSRRDSLIVPESRVGRLALAVGLIPPRGA